MLLVLAGLFCAGASPASAGTSLRSVSYHGISLRVPASWPIYRLAAHPTACVRFNRHALYLGAPGATQNCPVVSTGRTEAILVQPGSAAELGLSGTGVGRLLDRRARVVVTATWRANPGTIRTALGLRTLAGLTAAARPRVSPTPQAARAVRALRALHSPHEVSSSAPATPGAVFEGDGFDACSTPSESTMSAWGAASPYGAVGVYIGGVNMACSQPNLTASWVSTESADGWHIAPIYVGEQAPSNSCGCASITASQASSEGSAAAVDAVYDAQTVGIGAGNPIYFDMEGYSRSTANSTSVLAFLEAWTEQLHTSGYLSGVYSSDASGIADLAAEAGTGYVEPDDIWIAAYDNQASTADTTIPTTDWAANQRLHQYAGGNEETYGAVTIDVDNDYLDAATAAYGGGTAAAPVETVPSASAAPTIEGVPVAGQTLTELHAGWSGSPTSYGYQWYRCTKTGTGCVAISGATAQTYELTSADATQTVEVAETAINAAGTSPASDSTPTVPIAPSPSGFWSFTATGAVYNSEYQLLWGSPSTYGLKDFVGMVATHGRLGYWMVTRYATVYAFGNAKAQPTIRIAHPVAGIVRSPGGGYWLYTAAGNVYASADTSFYGSPAHLHLTHITGMASLPNGPGYWLVTRSGRVYAFGKAPVRARIRPTHPIIGIVAAPKHGYWLYTAHGDIYATAGAGYYGSPANQRVSDIASMLATPDGKGYWLITRTGTVYAYGDAATYPDPTLTSGAVVGLAG
jgi:hypothetical protein